MIRKNLRTWTCGLTGRTGLSGWLILSLGLLLMSGAAAAQSVTDAKSPGAATKAKSLLPPLISMEADNVAISDALKEVCRKARWGLVLDADEALLSQKVTVLLPQKKPADKVLDMILAQKGLQMRLDEGVVYVSALPMLKLPATDADAAPNASVEADGEFSDTKAEGVKDSDSDAKEFVISGISNLKNLRDHIKNRIHEEKKRQNRDSDRGVERVEMGGPVVIAHNETVSKAVSVGGSVTVEGKVENEAVAVGGSAVIRKGAKVMRDVVAVGGDVRVESGAIVDGEVVAVGGKVIVEDGATVKGDRVSVNIPFPAIGGIAGLVGMGAVFWVLAAVLRSLVILAVALIIVWIAPQRVSIAKDYLVKKTGWSLLSGLLILLGTVPAIVLLAVTVIGIPLIPFLILFLIAVVVFGLAALFSWLGYWIPLFRNKKSPTGAILLGFVLFLIINMIPIVGGIFLLLASLAAAGATFLSRFGKKASAL